MGVMLVQGRGNKGVCLEMVSTAPYGCGRASCEVEISLHPSGRDTWVEGGFDRIENHHAYMKRGTEVVEEASPSLAFLSSDDRDPL